MNKFYFNTGVRPHTISNPSFPYEYHKKKGNEIINGILMIPMYCDAPENATFMFACDNPNLNESTAENVIVCEIHNSDMQSKYAYFRVHK